MDRKLFYVVRIVFTKYTYREDLIMYPQITLHANNLDVTLLKTALNNLMEKAASNSDFYEITSNISDLLTQLNELEVK